jgi:hypothetical protein
MYYVRCNTRSSGASSKGTPAQALQYITDAHDSERDPSYSHAELRYIARLDPGWKQQLEGGRLALVGLGELHGCVDQAKLAREFVEACQPYHDKRGWTGYLSYTFTLPKEVSLVAEGHPLEAREAIYAGLQKTIGAAFPGKAVNAVATVHARNEAGEVHYHAHVLIGKFAHDFARRRTFSLNSASGGNTGRARLALLKESWKESLDAELKSRLGLTITQGAAYAKPALTLSDGTYVPALNRESRRILDKHLCFRMSTATPSGAVTSKNFRWTHFDPTIYELAAGKGRGWSVDAFVRHFPNLVPRLKTYEARVDTLKRIGYLSQGGRVTEAFTLHYCAHRGDHPELQKIRADLHKLTQAEKKANGTPGGGGAPPAPAPPGRDDETVALWLGLHRHQRLVQRLERLGISPEQFKRFHEEARQMRPDPEILDRLRGELKAQPARAIAARSVPRTRSIVRAYCTVQQSRVTTFFMVTRGILALEPGRLIALAAKMRARAERDFFWAKEQRLANVGRRLKPIFWLGKAVAPNEVDRLELAIKRCEQGSARQQSDRLYHSRVRRVYGNSRNGGLIVQFEANLREAALAKDPKSPEADQNLRAEIAKASAAVPIRPNEISLAQFEAGLKVLAKQHPEQHAHLARWRGRERPLLAALIQDEKGGATDLTKRERDAALDAGRLGKEHHDQLQKAKPRGPDKDDDFDR